MPEPKVIQAKPEPKASGAAASATPPAKPTLGTAPRRDRRPGPAHLDYDGAGTFAPTAELAAASAARARKHHDQVDDKQPCQLI